MPRIRHWLVALIVLTGLLAPALTAQAVVNTVAEFEETWARTDLPVANGDVDRTWMWGPEPFTEPLTEDYADSPDGFRAVQYFDKARMEITDPNAVNDGLWYVTNGLLVVELITGEMQLGDDTFETRSPAEVNVAGDPDDPNGPTYATFNGLLDAEPTPLNSAVTQRVDRDGNTSHDSALGPLGAIIVHLDDVTNHAIPEPFWTFMNSTGLVWEDGQTVEAQLFINPFYATGRPITEAYWAEVLVGGTPHEVLLQCFERRCLTYTPDNDPGWQVEAGNVGQHYYAWRYGDGEEPVDPADPPMSEFDYAAAIWDIDERYLASYNYMNELAADVAFDDATWVQSVTAETAFWRSLASDINQLNPPDRLTGIHDSLVDAYATLVDAAGQIDAAVEAGDLGQFEDGIATLELANAQILDALRALVDANLQLPEDEYLELIAGIEAEFMASVTLAELIWSTIDLDNPDDVDALLDEFQIWHDLAEAVAIINPPASHQSAHAGIVAGFELVAGAATHLETAITAGDQDAIDAGWDLLDDALDALDDVFESM